MTDTEFETLARIAWENEMMRRYEQAASLLEKGREWIARKSGVSQEIIDIIVWALREPELTEEEAGSETKR